MVCSFKQEDQPLNTHSNPIYNEFIPTQEFYDTKKPKTNRIPRSADPEADAQRRKRQFVRHQGQPRQQYRRPPVIVTPSPDVKVYSAADTGIEKRFFNSKKERRHHNKAKHTTRSPIYEPATYGPPTYDPAPLGVEPVQHSPASPPALYYDFKPTVNPYSAESSYSTNVDHVPGPPYDEFAYETQSKTTAWPVSYSVTTSPNPAPVPGATYYKPLAPSQNTISEHYATGGGREPESLYREETSTHFHPGDVVHRGSKELVRRESYVNRF